MSTIPSIESILLEVHQSLGCESYPSKTKNKFATGEMALSNHWQKAEEILDAIFRGLDMDPLAQHDTQHHLLNWFDFNKRVELGTWTFEADQRQVLWQMLGYSYVPGIARIAAHWNLEEAMDKGMPGGRFWYLPERPEVTGKSELYLPVAQVVDWLLDLLGMPLEEFVSKKNQNAISAEDEESERLMRSLYNWRKATTPDLGSFLKYFPDSMNVPFLGSFAVSSAETPAEQFAAALKFVEKKKLTVEQLRRKIPMTAAGRLESILNITASDYEKAYFVGKLAERYAQPSPKTIRQRLLFARLVQDGYVRLLKMLCPGVNKLCHDPKQNKLLQLFESYKLVYNSTIDAWRHCTATLKKFEDCYFEADISLVDNKILYLSVLPSKKKSAYKELPDYLNQCFFEFQPGKELEDHVGWDENSSTSIIRRNEKRLAELDEIERVTLQVLNNLKTSRPWPILQRVKIHSALTQVVRHGNLDTQTREMAIKRLYELARTPSQEIETIDIELNFLIQTGRAYSAETQSQVSDLLERAQSSAGFTLWKAVILHHHATHLLACNRFDDARKKFSEALEACKESNYALLRGVVARDIFCLEIATRKLIPEIHEKYYREMWSGGMFDGFDDVPSMEELATEAHDLFWNNLYKPYEQSVRINASAATKPSV